MADALYTPFKELLLGGDIDLATDTIKVALVDTGVYTFDATDEFYDDGGANDVASATIGTPQTLGTKAITDGVFDAADSTFSAVSGNTVEALVIYKDTGTPTTSPLIAYIDSATGLPVTPNGGDITVTWSSGANKIFSL